MYIDGQKVEATVLNPFVAPTLNEFYEWLKPQGKLATMLIAEKGVQEKGGQNDRPRHSKPDRVNYHNTTQLKCPKCGQNYKLTGCAEFRKMSHDKRRQLVSEQKLCFASCNTNHMVKIVARQECAISTAVGVISPRSEIRSAS